MKHYLELLKDPKFTSKLHLILMGGWGLLLIPSLIWWKESLVWIVAMSWYANFVGHWSSYQGSRAEKNGGS